MKNGDVAFFKTAKISTARKAPQIQFKGYGFGILLGHVPPFAKDPPPEHLLRLIGTVGFLTFDDVGEFLGDEQAALCVKKFEDKYYGKLVSETAPVGDLPVGETDQTTQGTLPLQENSSQASEPVLDVRDQGRAGEPQVGRLVDVRGNPIT